jgi:hypothetical protein
VSGRIRTVKPEWLEDELLALASSDARVLSIALMLLADDYGNGRANVVLLAGQAFPGKVLQTTASALAELVKIRFVALYEVDGQRYFTIRNWAKHQRVDKPGKPRVPAPGAKTPVSEQIHDTLATSPESRSNPPEAVANLPATRGSDPLPLQVGDRGPGTGPDPSQPTAPSDPPADAALPSSMPDEFAEECRKWLRSPFEASFGQPTKHPLVQRIAAAWSKPFGVASVRMIDNPARSPDLKAILEAFAAGYSVEELEAAADFAATDPWIAEVRRGGDGGPSAFTLPVLDTLLKTKGSGKAKSASKRRGGPPQPDHGVDPFAVHDTPKGAA